MQGLIKASRVIVRCALRMLRVRQYLLIVQHRLLILQEVEVVQVLLGLEVVVGQVVEVGVQLEVLESVAQVQALVLSPAEEQSQARLAQELLAQVVEEISAALECQAVLVELWVQQAWALQQEVLPTQVSQALQEQMRVGVGVI